MIEVRKLTNDAKERDWYELNGTTDTGIEFMDDRYMMCRDNKTVLDAWGGYPGDEMPAVVEAITQFEVVEKLKDEIHKVFTSPKWLGAPIVADVPIATNHNEPVTPPITPLRSAAYMTLLHDETDCFARPSNIRPEDPGLAATKKLEAEIRNAFNRMPDFGIDPRLLIDNNVPCKTEDCTSCAKDCPAVCGNCANYKFMGGCKFEMGLRESGTACTNGKFLPAGSR